MGNWDRQQDEKKELKERDKSRRENFGKLFYDLAKLTFAGLVVGGIAPLSSDMYNSNNWYVVIVGLLTTIMLSAMGYRIFK